jgi:hypothetical protein
MTQPLLSVLIPALYSRPWQLVQEELCHQAEPFGDEVEVLVYVDHGQETSGVKRQTLADRARGAYRVYADDDDRYSLDYISSLVEGCRTGVDVVTFRLEFTRVDRPGHREEWQFGLWRNDRRRGKMCVNHLCAWKSEIASRVAWCPDLGHSDDHLWYEPLYHAGLVKSEHHIPRVLYHYVFSPHVTVNQREDRRQVSRRYFGTGLGCFRHKQTQEILIQIPGKAPRGCYAVRDKGNQVSYPRSDEVILYHSVRIW